MFIKNLKKMSLFYCQAALQAWGYNLILELRELPSAVLAGASLQILTFIVSRHNYGDQENTSCTKLPKVQLVNDIGRELHIKEKVKLILFGLFNWTLQRGTANYTVYNSDPELIHFNQEMILDWLGTELCTSAVPFVQVQ